MKFPKTDFGQFGIHVPKSIHPNYVGGKCVLDDYKKKLIDPISSSVSSPGSFPYLKNYNDLNSSKQQSPPPNEIKKEAGEASPAFGGGQAKAPKFSENLNQLLDSEGPKKETKA